MNKKIENYAKLVIKKGINIQNNQTLVINSPVECSEFTRELVKEAYLNGAKEVVVHWNDEIIDKFRYLYGAEEIFEVFPEWKKESLEYYRKKGAAFLSVYAADPELLKDVDPQRVAKSHKARSTALREYYENVMGNSNQWCVVSAPTKAWAKAIFKGDEESVAVSKLWELILKIVRADKENPVFEWEKHLSNLKNTLGFLNEKKFKKLRYKNSLGTNLEIELPMNHKWLGGAEKSKEGVEFVANIPTEEVFTLPLKTGVNGVVYSSKPLIHGGNIIDEFMLEFKDGKVINFSAKKGENVLKELLDTDENARYLGEVALVQYDSPISNSKTIFFNTLYDENASCHLALGSAYPVCLEGADGLGKEELEKLGANVSLIHEDFMIGTFDLEIVGIDADGKESYIMKDGNFVFAY